MGKLEAENPRALLGDGSRVRKSANLEARVSQSETAKFVILEYFKGLLFVKNIAKGTTDPRVEFILSK